MVYRQKNELDKLTEKVYLSLVKKYGTERNDLISTAHSMASDYYWSRFSNELDKLKRGKHPVDVLRCIILLDGTDGKCNEYVVNQCIIAGENPLQVYAKMGIPCYRTAGQIAIDKYYAPPPSDRSVKEAFREVLLKREAM